jgi:ABC-type branched-subunit amino acid transport system permease subunit
MNYFFSLVNEAALFGALAALQVLLLNRLGLAFAAVPVFTGLGAYAVAAWRLGAAASLGMLLLAGLLAIGMSLLANYLRRDHYLLATLAALECVGGAIGMSTALGGREGLPLPASWSVGGPGFETGAMFWTLGTLALVILAIRLVLNSAAGVAVDRIHEHPESAVRWFQASKFRVIVICLCVILATAAGILYLAYHGRVSPGVFSLEFALLVLTFSVMAGRWPELAALSALLYWILPYWMTKLFPFSQQGAADLVRVCWGGLLITSVLLPRLLHDRQRSLRRAAS